MRGGGNWAARAGVLGAVANDLLLAREPRLNVVHQNSSFCGKKPEVVCTSENVILIHFWSFEHLSHHRTYVVENGNRGGHGHNGNGGAAAKKWRRGYRAYLAFLLECVCALAE